MIRMPTEINTKIGEYGAECELENLVVEQRVEFLSYLRYGCSE